jgi:beta-phosphoglucomutase-like phosphatase (HAD superfamily)
MFEYAISDGDGTLIDFGVMEYDAMVRLWKVGLELRHTFIYAPCPDDCQTSR